MTSLSNVKEPATVCKLIAVPGQLITGGSVYDVASINGRPVSEHVKYRKDEYIPIMFQLLAFGQYIDFSKFWEKWDKSDIVYFFVVFDN